MKYRLPIKVFGVIELEDGCAIGILHTETFSWAPFNKVTPYGTDPDVVEVTVADMTAVEADANIVEGIRQALPSEIEWRVE